MRVPPESRDIPPHPTQSGDRVLEAVVARSESARILCERAFAKISAADQKMLDTTAPKLIADFIAGR